MMDMNLDAQADPLPKVVPVQGKAGVGCSGGQAQLGCLSMLASG